MKYKGQIMKNLVLILSVMFQYLPFTSNAENHTQTFESEGMKLRLEQVADGFGIPWGMAFLSTNQLLITEREGSIKRLEISSGRITTVKNPPTVYADGQAGMLDVAISPNYKKTGWIYFTYVKNINGDGATTLSRAKLKLDRLIEWQDLLITKSTTDTTRHFGSRITFDDKGHVFFGVGDRGIRDNSQNLMNHAGTIIRLNLDGSVPIDNPFIKNTKALPEIWSYGHRNPQGLSYDHNTNKLWSIEHGPRGGDEINLIKKAANYGWPVISYGKEYWGPVSVGEGTHKAGMEQPVKTYIPSIAPGSLIVYSGAAFPHWQGNLFSGALKLQHINRVAVNDQDTAIQEERLVDDLNERIRSLAQSPEGWLYFSTDSGKIFRVMAE